MKKAKRSAGSDLFIKIGNFFKEVFSISLLLQINKKPKTDLNGDSPVLRSELLMRAGNIFFVIDNFY